MICTITKNAGGIDDRAPIGDRQTTVARTGAAATATVIIADIESCGVAPERTTPSDQHGVV